MNLNCEIFFSSRRPVNPAPSTTSNRKRSGDPIQNPRGKKQPNYYGGPIQSNNYGSQIQSTNHGAPIPSSNYGGPTQLPNYDVISSRAVQGNNQMDTRQQPEE